MPGGSLPGTLLSSPLALGSVHLTALLGSGMDVSAVAVAVRVMDPANHLHLGIPLSSCSPTWTRTRIDALTVRCSAIEL